MRKIKEWTDHHINLTAWFTYIMSFTVVTSLAWNIPFPPNLAYATILIAVGMWLLRKKKRSLSNLWWAGFCIISISIGSSSPFISNVSSYPDLVSYASRTIGLFSISLIVWTLLRNKSKAEKI